MGAKIRHVILPDELWHEIKNQAQIQKSTISEYLEGVLTGLLNVK